MRKSEKRQLNLKKGNKSRIDFLQRIITKRNKELKYVKKELLKTKAERDDFEAMYISLSEMHAAFKEDIRNCIDFLNAV